MTVDWEARFQSTQFQALGLLQLQFMIDQGLRPEHKLYDVGCGCLRGGIHFIRYLDSENYTGADKDKEMLEGARWAIERFSLRWKRPAVLCFDGFRIGIGVDYAFAHSVLTHLHKGQARLCIESVLAASPIFYASFNRGDVYKEGQPHPTRDNERARVKYPFSLLQEIADEAGGTAEDLGDYGHHAGQQMAIFRRKA